MSQRNFAVIGAAGYIAPRHLRAIKETGNNLVAALDLNDSIGVIDSISPECEFFTEFERFEDYVYRLRGTESEIEFVSVCSPNYLHEAHIAAGLRMGCNVICEKPLVPSIAAVDRLQHLEHDSGKKVANILQLRLHDEIRALKNRVDNAPSNKKYNVELTYITSRGKWYLESWKGDPRKSFGLTMNIGIHFFDMLGFLFGSRVHSEVHYRDDTCASGYLEFKHACVPWFLSIDANDLPSGRASGQSTYRNISCDGDSIEFSAGFTDLHTLSYMEILEGRGFGLQEARASIETVEGINRARTSSHAAKGVHPLYQKLLEAPR